MLKNLFSKEMVMNALLLTSMAVIVIALHENMPNGFKIKALSKDA